MLKKPLEKEFPMTNDWADPRTRSMYTKYGLLAHNGIDYGTPTGTRVVAPHSGKIIESLNDSGYGWYVKIENSKEGSVLAHFKEQSSCKVGSEVKQGDLVGLSGNTGNSTGPHLHWGFYRFPRKKDNGFSGTVDQTHWIGLDDSSEQIAKLQEEVDYERNEKEKYKKEARELREVVSSQAEKIAKLGEEIKTLNQASAEYRSQIAQLQGQFAEVSRERDGLLDTQKVLDNNTKKLITENNDLKVKLIAQEPLKTYSTSDLINEIFNRIFKKKGV